MSVAKKQREQEFAEHHGLDYEKSVLNPTAQVQLCQSCLIPYVKRCSCPTQQPLIVHVLAHNPPKLNGVELADADCEACKVARLPSKSYCQIKICDLALRGQPATAEKVAYQLEMCEDLYTLQCTNCKQVMMRSEYMKHSCGKIELD